MSPSMEQEGSQPLTYEASRARQSTWGQPDKIHWDKDYAFRDSPYRLLHHQKGVMGTFRIQLLEAKDLERSYWSALALGPVKHLGLSKAHGNVSAYCTVELRSFEQSTTGTCMSTGMHTGAYTCTRGGIGNEEEDENQKLPAASTQYKSQVVPNQNSPVWTNCEWDVPLKKGIQDAVPLMLHVEAIEDASATESFGLPLSPSGDDRMLGAGDVDITPLCLGEDKGQAIVGVMDVWVPILKNGKKTGQVRVLVSYSPHGMTPQPNDLVALEAFARRSPARASCIPVMPPMEPLRVLQAQNGYLLVEYRMRNGERATLRVHRKAVFVIERCNIVDGALNLALLPADIFLSTPVGHATQSIAGPLLEAGGELVMPALLSAKLVWGLFRTTGFAALSGVAAATGAVINQSRNAHEDRQRQNSFAQPVHAHV